VLTLADTELTEEDAATSRWNTLEYLTDEEEIASFLQAALLNISIGDCEPSHLFDALATAAKARIINHLATNAIMDRKMLCGMFQDPPRSPEAPSIDRTTIIKIAHSFSIPLPDLDEKLTTV
jgi:DNA-binding phage protein